VSSFLHFHVRGELVGAPARTQEEVVGLGALPADPKQLEQVPELAMDVSTDLCATDLCQLLRRNASGRGQTDGDGRVDPLDVCLLDEDLARLETEFLDLLFGYRLAASVHDVCVSGSCASCPRREEGTHQFLSCSIWLRVGAS
jgi:hypothetical protein